MNTITGTSGREKSRGGINPAILSTTGSTLLQVTADGSDPRVFARLHELRKSGRISGSDDDASGYEDGSNKAEASADHGGGDHDDHSPEETSLKLQMAGIEALSHIIGENTHDSYYDFSDVYTKRDDGGTTRARTYHDAEGAVYTDVQNVNADGSLGAGECRRAGATSFAAEADAKAAQTTAQTKPEEPGFLETVGRKLKNIFSSESVPPQPEGTPTVVQAVAEADVGAGIEVAPGQTIPTARKPEVKQQAVAPTPTPELALS